MSMRSFRKPVQIAEEFGKALDQDNFEQLKKLLAPQCTYCIGDIELIGPEAIASPYEQNMLEGRETLDELAWGGRAELKKSMITNSSSTSPTISSTGGIPSSIAANNASSLVKTKRLSRLTT